MNDFSGAFAAALAILLIWSIILIGIICAGVMPRRRDDIQLQNQKLLALIAESSGVDIERIRNVLGYDPKKSHKGEWKDLIK